MKSMKKVAFPFLAACLGIFLLRSASFSQQTAGELFEKAVYVEEGQGDLQKAIGLYQDIVKRFPENRDVAAKAQLHIGLCYEKLGLKEAEKAFQKVIDSYPEQSEAVKVAKEKLDLLLRTQAIIQKGDKDFKLTKVFSGGYVDSISPDGKQLLISSSPSGIGVRDVETGKDIPLGIEARVVGGWMTHPIWSPDCKMIAYMDKLNNLSIVAATGGPSIPLIKADAEAVKAEEMITPKSWTPDSKKVIFHIPAKGLFAVPASGGKPEEILVFEDPGKAREHEEMTLSPDGRLVAYVSSPGGNKDIYVMPVKGGASVRITTNPAEDSGPMWSYDGRRVAFNSKRTESPEIWVVGISPEGKPEGLEFQVSRGGFWGGTWTRDGKIGYCTGLRLEHIFTANPDGSEEIQVTHFPAFNGFPCWSPDGKKIVFRSDYGQRSGVSRIWTVPATGGEARLLALGEKGGWPSTYCFSPDGKVMGFVTGNELQPNKSLIKLVPIEGGEPKELLSFDKEIGTLDWSPDGKKIIFTYSIKPSTYADTDEYLKESLGGISLISTEGGEVKTLIPAEKKGLGYAPCLWSPDGKRIAFGSFDYEEWVKGGRKEEGLGLWVKDMKTGDSKLIMKGADGYRLCWSPDGRSIIFEKRVRGMDFDLYKIPAEGGMPEKMNIKGRSPAFSPDGKKIAYSRRIGQGYEFWLVENFLPIDKKEK